MSIQILEGVKRCKICGEQNPPENHYYRVHKIPIKKYIEENFPKKNLLTGERMAFKSLEGYIQNDFDNRNELKAYLQNSAALDIKDYLINWLKIRKELKKIIYCPAQFESKSLLFPSISYLIKNYGVKFCEDVVSLSGLKMKYNYYATPLFDNNKNLEYIVDSREQTPLIFPNMEIGKLNVGDYSLKENNKEIYFERKTLNDFLGTMSKGYDRFNRELERCAANNDYLIILILAEYKDLLEFNFKSWMKNVKASSDFIMHRAREIIQKFPDNCQFLAINKDEAIKVINKIYNCREDVKTLDLQLLYEKKLL